MSTADLDKIKTPFSRLLLLWRRRYAPVIVWAGAIVLAVVLVQEQHVYVDAPGVVESNTVFVASLVDGTVQSLAVDLLDPVEAGQVVAVMDDALVRSEMAVAEAELERVRALLDAEMANYAQDQQLEQASVQNDLRRFQLNEEEARIDHLDRVIGHETDKVTLERLAVQLKREAAMRDQHLLDDATYDQTRLTYDALKIKVEKDKQAIELAEKNIDTAAARRETQETMETNGSATDAVLRALQADIGAQQAQVAAVQERRRRLTLVAPVSGQVAAITRRPGESVLAGDPVLTISGEAGNRVLAYVDERTAKHFDVGDSVELLSKTHPRKIVTGEIVKVGAVVEPFPLRLQASPMMVQHGYAILVGGLPEGAFRPGEALDLQLRGVTR